MEETKCKNNKALIITLAVLALVSSATTVYLYFSNKYSITKNDQTDQVSNALLEQAKEEKAALNKKLEQTYKDTDFDPKKDDIKTIVEKIDLLNQQLEDYIGPNPNQDK